MFESAAFIVFLATASLIAISPGPGLFYVAARTLSGGRSEGLASSFGTGLGGLVHVAAGAWGISAIVMASAEAFTLLKWVGAVYLLWLGYKTIREARADIPLDASATGVWRAFREGILVEALNPKTAAFFLAFLPQFVDVSQPVAAQFVVLGLISVALNTAVDVVVTIFAAQARNGLLARPDAIRRLRQGSGVIIGGLGFSLLFARRASS